LNRNIIRLGIALWENHSDVKSTHKKNIIYVSKSEIRPLFYISSDKKNFL